MSASRPEDVQEILSNIPDIDAFNSHLHQMLFGTHGLFMVLEMSDALEAIMTVGKVLRVGAVLGPASMNMPN